MTFRCYKDLVTINILLIYYLLLYNTLLNYRNLIGYLRSRDIK